MISVLSFISSYEWPFFVFLVYWPSPPKKLLKEENMDGRPGFDGLLLLLDA